MKRAWAGTGGFLAALVLIGATSAALACGGRESVASKSDAALREAQRRGESFAGRSHVHGAGEAPQATHEAEAHAHGGEDMAAMDMHEPAGEGPATGGHGAPGHEHATAGHPAGHSMSGMAGHTMPDTTATEMPGHDMGAMRGHAASPSPAPPPPRALTAAPGAAAAALVPDAVDAAAPTSIEEAARSAAIGPAPAGMAGMAGMHGHGESSYRQRDVGRGGVASPAPSAPPAHAHPTPPGGKP